MTELSAPETLLPPAGGPHTAPLGHAPMDAVHDEFDRLLARALAADSDPEAHLAPVVAHLTAHFDAEARWMTESDYPNGACHRDEHAAVLASAHEVLALDAARRPAVARSFFEALAGWFPAHAHHLDSALAHWLCKRAHGGKPLVFHRSAATAGGR